MQCLQVLRKKGRSRRLYSQAHLQPVNPEPSAKQEELQNVKRSHFEPEKENTVLKESKSSTENPSGIVTENPKEVPEVSKKEEGVPMPAEPEPPIEPEIPVFSLQPFIELNQKLGLESLSKLLELIRGKKLYSESRKHKLASTFHFFFYPYLVSKAVTQPCLLPPFDDSIHNEKRICCEVWKVRREQAHSLLHETAKPSAMIFGWFITKESENILDICDKYQTKVEKLVKQRTTRHDPKNQISHTLIRCSGVLHTLYTVYNIAKIHRADAMIKRVEECDKTEERMKEDSVEEVNSIIGKIDAKFICKAVYEKYVGSGLYHLIKQRHPNLLKILYEILEKQQKDLEVCQRVLKNVKDNSKKYPYAFNECKTNPMLAIKFCLTSYPIS